VVAQLLAEGARRVLLVVPKSLVGQWQTELYSLFGIETREGRLDPDSFEGSGVFLVHRELAGGAKGASILKTVDPFELIVVDEAHELWGLVQYVEPTGTLLGKPPTFRELFCDGSDRTVLPEQARELRRRLATSCNAP
jgi:hypothetical protein